MKKWIAAVAVLGFAAANAVVYQHAKAMTDFVPVGERTASPEDLGVLDKLAVLLTGITLPRPEHDSDPGAHEMAYQSHYFDNATGHRLHAWHIPAEGSRAMVLMFHGYGGSAAAMLEHAAALHQLGHSVLLVDFFGAGLSSAAHTTVGVAEAADVAAAVRHSRVQWPELRVVLFGQSMGAAAVSRAVAQLGVVADGLVLESSYDSLLNTAKVRFRSMGLPDTPFAQWLLFWGGVRHGFDPFAMRPVDDVALIDTPTLILQGGADPRVPLAQVQAFAALDDHNTRTETFAAAGHVGMLHSEPARWRALVGRFIESLLADG